jgi:hypothetical protein
MGAVKRALIAIVAAAVGLAAIYHFLLGGSSVEARLLPLTPASAIGSGEDAVGVSAGGVVLAGSPAPPEGSLPSLPVSEPPKQGYLAGPLLEQALVLGAAPAPLCPYVEASRYGESGVDVTLRSGIELRFGDASQAALKWRAALAMLAAPTTTTLDYVDLHSPRHPAIGGSGHTLPPVSSSPEGELSKPCGAAASGGAKP